jgi:phosphomannomutase
MSRLLEQARQWVAGDPDPTTRDEIRGLIDQNDLDGLEQRFLPEITFGTAGIRGTVGAGPARMNRAVVIRTTAGLAAVLNEGNPGPVIVGFDARPTSRGFAEDVAGVLAASAIKVVFFPAPTPTPLVAFTAKVMGAAAAVVITASHNPPQDNGYKVYGANAAQIIPPLDTEISARIRESAPANQIPMIDDPLGPGTGMVTLAPGDIFDRYRAEVDQARPRPTGSDLKIVYTPLHGCGGHTVSRLLETAGHRNMIRVAEQYEPDGTFPTVSFPNPEEKGALDLAIATARRESADLIIANDPDADRLAAVMPLTGEWRALSGNDLGCLLGDFTLSHSRVTRPIVVSSLVSSPMLGRIAEARGARHESTLTGFKWIVNAGLALEAAGEGTFLYGYEEALGYTIGKVVRDKDGMSAALVFCDLVETLRARGESVWDQLLSLWREVGIWASAQHSLTVAGANGSEQSRGAIETLGTTPPAQVCGLGVAGVTDYRVGAQTRPFWLGAQDLIELSFGSAGRALVRPSGTEPKIKVYVDLTQPAGRDPMAQQMALGDRALEVAAAIADVIDR